MRGPDGVAEQLRVIVRAGTQKLCQLASQKDSRGHMNGLTLMKNCYVVLNKLLLSAKWKNERMKMKLDEKYHILNGKYLFNTYLQHICRSMGLVRDSTSCLHKNVCF